MHLISFFSFLIEIELWDVEVVEAVNLTDAKAMAAAAPAGATV